MQVATGRAPTARRSVEEILISVLSSPEDDPTSIAGELSHTPEVGRVQAPHRPASEAVWRWQLARVSCLWWGGLSSTGSRAAANGGCCPRFSYAPLKGSAGTPAAQLWVCVNNI
jgi:hypothetical protein